MITISATDVIVDGQTATFEDIYQYAVTNNKTQYVNKLGNSYLIKTNLRLKNNATVQDTNKTILIEGQYIEIIFGSTLKLGTKRFDGSTCDGCSLSAPNILLNYGFGCTTVGNSGNLLLYNSTINIWGFWSFFKGDNLVEIIDCFIDGFGRVSGPNSILRNIIFKRSHGIYGCLSPKGVLKEMSNMSSYDSLESYHSAWKTNFKCSLYHNPEFAPNLDIYYGTYGGYDKLLYVEDTPGKWTTTLYGSKVLGNYNIFRETTGNHSFYHKYRFKPKIQNPDGSTVVGATVEITNNKNIIEFTGTTDINGYIDCWLTYFRNIVNVNVDEIVTPHSIKITKDNKVITTSLYVNKNMEDFPLFLLNPTNNSTTIDYDRIQNMIDNSQQVACDCVGNKLSAVEAKLSTIIVSMGDKVVETQTIIKSNNDVTIIL